MSPAPVFALFRIFLWIFRLRYGRIQKNADFFTISVIAEGVETEEQLLALKAMGCDLVQGYYFSRPVPAEEFEAFLKKSF